MKIETARALALLSYTLLVRFINLIDGAQGSKHSYDRLAPIGQLFTFKLPAGLFNDKAKEYEVTEAGSGALPDWLFWDEDSRTLYGVPNRRDYLPVPKYLIYITAIGDSGQRVSEVITITVVQDASIENGGGNRPFRNILGMTSETCRFDDVSLVMVAFPAEYFLPPEKRQSSAKLLTDPKSNYQLLKNVTKMMSLPQSCVRLLDAAYVGELERLSHSSAEKDAISRVHGLSHVSSSSILFILGCGDLRGNIQVQRKADNLTRTIVKRMLANEADASPFLKFTSEAKSAIKAVKPFVTRLAVPLPRKRYAFDGDNVLSQWPAHQAFYSTQNTDQPNWTPTLALISSTPKSISHKMDVEDVDDENEDGYNEEEEEEEEEEEKEMTTVLPANRRTHWTAATSRNSLYAESRRPNSMAGLLDGDISDHQPGHFDGETPSMTQTTKFASFDPTPSMGKTYDKRPQLRYSLGSIKCTINVLCEHKIPKHTFVDPEDGNTEKLKLRLNFLKGPVSGSKHWMFLDDVKKILVGIPMSIGNWEYQLIAMDSAGNSINDAFEVHVIRPAFVDDIMPPSHVFSVGLALAYSSFSTHLAKHVHFVRRLAQNLGDASDTSKVLFNGVYADPNNASLSVVRWSNATLVKRAALLARKRTSVADSGKPSANTKNGANVGSKPNSVGRYGASDMDVCVKDQVDAILKVQQTILFRDRVNAEMFPFVYVLRSFAKWCNETSQTVVQFPVESTISDTGLSGTLSDKSDGLFLATVLPVIIVLTLLCLALVIACVLYRKSKQAKKSSADSPSGRSSGGDARFLSSKGTPVIFPDEMLNGAEPVVEDEKMSAHAPMLLKVHEKPPLAPPDFGRLNGAGLGNGFSKIVAAAPDRQTSASPLLTGRSSTSAPYPAGYQSPLSGAKLAQKQRAVTAATPFDETKLAATQQPLLQREVDSITATTIVDENPLYRAPPHFTDTHTRHQFDGRTPNKNIAASP